MGSGLAQEVLRYTSGALFLCAGAMLVSVPLFTVTDNYHIAIGIVYTIPIGLMLSMLVLACGGLNWLAMKQRFALIAGMLFVSVFSYHYVPRLEMFLFQVPELHEQSEWLKGPLNEKVSSHSISAFYFPQSGLKPPTLVGKTFKRAPKALMNH